MFTNIDDAERIAGLAKRLLSAQQKYQKLQARWKIDATPKQAQKFNADLNWLAMEINKIEYELHVACVDASLADLRNAEHYKEQEFRPSGWHTYRWMPPQPKGLMI